MSRRSGGNYSGARWAFSSSRRRPRPEAPELDAPADRTWPAVPGAPALGHVTARGWWHPGAADGCPKCEL